MRALGWNRAQIVAKLTRRPGDGAYGGRYIPVDHVLNEDCLSLRQTVFWTSGSFSTIWARFQPSALTCPSFNRHQGSIISQTVNGRMNFIGAAGGYLIYANDRLQ